jgi:hypothetical protein
MDALSQRRSQDVSCWLQVRCAKQTPVQSIRADTARGRMRALIGFLSLKDATAHELVGWASLPPVGLEPSVPTLAAASA